MGQSSTISKNELKKLRLRMAMAAVAIFILAIHFLLVASDAHAVLPKCSSSSGSVQQQASLIHKIARFGKDDNRRTYADYAKEKGLSTEAVDRLFEATGELLCGNLPLSAQLTGADNVITTAAHAFFLDECIKEPPGTCTFRPHGSDERIEVDMKSVIGTCPYPNAKKDWAVARLMKRTGRSYFQIPKSDIVPKNNNDVIQTAARHRGNFFRNGKLDQVTPTLADCKVRNAYYYSGHTILHDCDTGSMSSGGGQVIETNKEAKDSSRYTLYGINIGHRTSYKSGSTYPDYNSKTDFNVAIPISGDFLKALRKMTGKPEGAQD